MDSEVIILILAVPFGLCILYGLIRWKTLRARWSNVIGVGGAYIILLGLMSLVGLIRSIIGGVKLNGEFIVMLLVTLACLAFFVLKELQLPTVMQKILFPFAAISIAGAFIWKLLFGILTHTGLSGTPEGVLPTIVYDASNRQYTCVYRTPDFYVYRNSDGDEIYLRPTDISGSGANTNKGPVHWF